MPIANAVLTTENDDQALVRMMQKGKEAAEAAIEMARLVQTISKR
ncbi:MAG TPA: 6,7-dimethyl-8-ribityllumazine synthase [Rugosibacter sp.]|nr:6,7-dimethyl-8-ribityllumazine synthase [Rugosibacter sp.]